VVCVARELLRAERRLPLPTFTLTFDATPQCDERPFAEAVLAQGGLEGHRVAGDQAGPLNDLDRMLWQADEAFFAPSAFLQWNTYAAAQREGIGVLLDGYGGDQVVSWGLLRVADLLRAGRIRALRRELAGLELLCDFSPRWSLWSFGLRPLVPGRVRRARDALRFDGLPWWARGTFIEPAFARRVHREAEVQRAYREPAARSSREAHYLDIREGLSRDPWDATAGAFGVEPRYPFLDRRLAEFCLALPADQKLSDGWTRVIMRRALAELLPPAILYRGWKARPSSSFARGLLAFDRERLDDVVLTEPPAALREYVDVSAWQAAYRRYAAPGADRYASSAIPAEMWTQVAEIWKVATLALWLRGPGGPPGPFAAASSTPASKSDKGGAARAASR
jgi:asparagine synthase (glutamine-hydrolysing)